MQSQLLQSVQILITRPQHQADNLVTMVTTAAGAAILFPTIVISAAKDRAVLETSFRQLLQYDLVIFTSTNAVQYSSDLIKQFWPQISAKPSVAAIGPATVKALQHLHVQVNITPSDTYNSATLLALPELQNNHYPQVLIVTGAEGNEQLAQVLTQRGAKVTTAVAYERCLPNTPIASLLQQWQSHPIDIIVCTSMHGLKNLYTLLTPTAHLLLQTPLLVISQNMLIYAQCLGWQMADIIVAENATDAAIFTALTQWRQKNYDP